ncbi:MAG: HD domain-containing protein [Bacteroidota bacterium]
MEISKTVMDGAKAYMFNLLTYHLPKTICYHTLEHTMNVFEAVGTIAGHMDLDENEKDILRLAALLHDSGFVSIPKEHERISVLIANSYLKHNNVPVKIRNKVADCIMATKLGSVPKDDLESVMQDADMFHISMDGYWRYNGLLRKELNQLYGLKFGDGEWFANNLEFLQGHEFRTGYGKQYLEWDKQNRIKENGEIREKLLKGEARTLWSIEQSASPSLKAATIVLNSGCQIAI